MSATKDAGVRQLKNGCWAYRFSISINGQKISKRGSTDSEGNPLKTKGSAIKARQIAISITLTFDHQDICFGVQEERLDKENFE